jgi:hypothetical protein
MKFNINHKVRVKLTDNGRGILSRKEHAFSEAFDLPAKEPLVREVDGWSEWQLWDLMREFGPHIYNGCKVPFETEIEIIEKQ